MMIVVPSLRQLPDAARTLVEHVGSSPVVALYGGMGAGKTTLVKAVCKVLGVNDVVTSPSFSLVNEYRSDTTGESIYHFDFFRLQRLEEAYDMGCDDYFSSGARCFVEWPELVEPLLPEDTVRVRIESLADGSRTITLNPEQE